jgi:hypothetical protein
MIDHLAPPHLTASHDEQPGDSGFRRMHFPSFPVLVASVPGPRLPIWFHPLFRIFLACRDEAFDL